MKQRCWCHRNEGTEVWPPFACSLLVSCVLTHSGSIPFFGYLGCPGYQAQHSDLGPLCQHPSVSIPVKYSGIWELTTEWIHKPRNSMYMVPRSRSQVLIVLICLTPKWPQFHLQLSPCVQWILPFLHACLIEQIAVDSFVNGVGNHFRIQ